MCVGLKLETPVQESEISNRGAELDSSARIYRMGKNNGISKKTGSQFNTNNIELEGLVLRPSLRLWVIYCAIFIAALSAKLFFTHEQENFELLWRSFVLAGGVYLGYLYLKRVTTSYTLNVLEVVGRIGVFSTQVVRIPLNRITNYECKASFLERLLGLNNVMLDTPGGTGYELTMSRLSKQDSDTVVETLRYLMGQQKIAEAGSNEELRSLRKKAIGN